MIDIQNISITLNNKTIIQNLSTHIYQGEKIVITGPSGTGKSTLLSTIVGLTPIHSGKIFVNKLPLSTENILTIRKQIAWLPQEFSLPFKTVIDWIETIFNLKQNRKKRPSMPQVIEQLKQLGLTPAIYHKNLNETSGGERQRIMMAIAILLDKPILLLDEPTSALDRDSVKKIITTLQSLEHRTIVSVSHDEEYAQSFDKIIKLG